MDRREYTDAQYREIETDSEGEPDRIVGGSPREEEELNHLKDELRKEREQEDKQDREETNTANSKENNYQSTQNTQNAQSQQSQKTKQEGGSTVGTSDNTIASLMWLSALVGFFTLIGFLIPVAIWMIKKDDSEVINQNGKEIMNVLLSYIVIYSLISTVLMIVLIGFLLAPIVILLAFIFIIVGAVTAADGGVYKTPLTIRFIK